MPSKWFEEQPKNRNFLSPTGFKLELELFAGVDFFCQSVNIPDISAPSVDVPTRFRGIPIAASGGVTYGDLRLKFIVDEDMANYLTIHKWIRENNLANQMDTKKDPEYSKAQIIVLNSNFNPNIIIDFDDLFPVDLSELSFDVEDRDVDYITSSATFKFSDFRFTNKRNMEI